jgi:hypothetical protein
MAQKKYPNNTPTKKLISPNLTGRVNKDKNKNKENTHNNYKNKSHSPIPKDLP